MQIFQLLQETVCRWTRVCSCALSRCDGREASSAYLHRQCGEDGKSGPLQNKCAAGSVVYLKLPENATMYICLIFRYLYSSNSIFLLLHTSMALYFAIKMMQLLPNSIYLVTLVASHTLHQSQSNTFLHELPRRFCSSSSSSSGNI